MHVARNYTSKRTTRTKQGTQPAQASKPADSPEKYKIYERGTPSVRAASSIKKDMHVHVERRLAAAATEAPQATLET